MSWEKVVDRNVTIKKKTYATTIATRKNKKKEGYIIIIPFARMRTK